MELLENARNLGVLNRARQDPNVVEVWRIQRDLNVTQLVVPAMHPFIDMVRDNFFLQWVKQIQNWLLHQLRD